LREAEESGLVVDDEIIETEVTVETAENYAIPETDTSMNIDGPAQVCCILNYDNMC
jgi:hypothetical protein